MGNSTSEGEPRLENIGSTAQVVGNSVTEENNPLLAIHGWYGSNGKIYPSEEAAQEAARVLLLYLGEAIDREGLVDTPKRMLKALREMTEGYQDDPKTILQRRFSLFHDELTLLTRIPFVSLCEHHLLPFSGVASVGYVPANNQIVGLSKLARLVACFARRLQIQEQLTGQIADSLVEHLQPLGAACIIQAEHSCLACRGARVSGTRFVTSALRGCLKEDVRARAELMSLIGTG